MTTQEATVFAHVESLLLQVDKPARYTGGEFNAVTKPDSQVQVRLALAFPDVYDIGMSYHGFKILYEQVNAVEGLQAERVFAPWPDMEQLLRKHNLPLYLLESKRPVAQADVVGFTLQHELNYTNLLNMLDLSGIKLLASERSEDDPIVLAGGHGAFNPEVLAEFIDAFVIGEGEQALLEILEVLRRAKASPSPLSREEKLLELAQLPGVYVPAFYNCTYNEDGTVASIRPNRPGVPSVVRKTHYDLRQDMGSTRPVVPLMRVVHDRLAIEIKRGCASGCRFCHAGMITRPVRERTLEQILEIAREGIDNTGYDELSLLSLSSADYSRILQLTRALRQEMGPRKVSVSLPSLRINAFDVELADEIGSVRKSGFTFAPEAGSQRLRDAINKAVDEQHFLETLEAVLQRGWRTLKFYFMCGLPTETEEDLQGIIDLTEKATDLGKRYCGKKFQLNLSLSPFVPKPQTPFQWHAQPTQEEFESKYRYVESRISRRYVSLKKHDLRESGLEGVLSRGDRKVGRAILRAWQLGCKFDNWSDFRHMELWQQAFADSGVDPAFYASRTRGDEEVFPWDHIDAGPGREFLWREKTKSEAGKPTADCSTSSCAGCKMCDHEVIRNILTSLEDALSPEMAAATEAPAGKPRPAANAPQEPVQRMRLFFSKSGTLRFISHLDMAKAIHLICRRSGLEIAYSQGFNPQPKLQFAPPVSLGACALQEPLEIVFNKRYDPEEVIERLQAIPLEGLAWIDAQELPLYGPSLATQLVSASFLVEIPRECLAEGGDEELKRRLARFLESEQLIIETQGKGKPKDLRAAISKLEHTPTASGHTFKLCIGMNDTVYVNPVTALEAILGTPLRQHAQLTRLGFETTCASRVPS